MIVALLRDNGNDVDGDTIDVDDDVNDMLDEILLIRDKDDDGGGAVSVAFLRAENRDVGATNDDNDVDNAIDELLLFRDEDDDSGGAVVVPLVLAGIDDVDDKNNAVVGLPPVIYDDDNNGESATVEFLRAENRGVGAADDDKYVEIAFDEILAFVYEDDDN